VNDQEREKVYRATIRVLARELLSGELIQGDSKWARPIADKVMEEVLNPKEQSPRKFVEVIDELLQLVAALDPGWNSITTPDIVVEAAALVAGLKGVE
jgi:hypothetical protein